MTREHASRLDERMNQRRLELGMKWREVATAAGISYEALRAARMGEGRPAPLTRSGIERALRWHPGSIDAIFTGGEPTPLGEALAEEPIEATIAELAARLNEAERAHMDLARRFEELLAQQKGDEGTED